ncbi:4-hydroxy-tetrahydrodipicolinate reductase [Wenzhouxiangella sp. XN79A]|uniref:4-hydroxy-tetrahydrodipicolinate reductase n=1 Tax=Wenzhouxiangella sp. XN79A TaxID=2724193 RepID=UPI00144AF847|nr:4-hydroxy-tetrahydrodipicolinate reductase [Wenzhouxiangella sp. XN79A]
MKILLNGATGKVGRLIEALAETDAALELVGRGSRDHPLAEPAGADVLIDFSRPAALVDALALACRHRIPVVTGTTGLDDAASAALGRAAETVPVCRAANFAIGVHLLRQLVRDAAHRLGPAFDIELVETHHREKIDAPSGTALSLARAAAEGRGLDPAHALHSDGHAGGARDRDRIGVQSLRGGDVVGEHEVHFLGDGERLVLVHRATDRSLFARGALRAAAWLVGRPAGLYGLDDVLADR